jgi:anti-sigma B factor antagonist
VIAVAIQADAYRDNLKVTVRQRASLTVLHLRGELDLATEPILHEAFVLLDLDGGIDLAIDLRGLDFLGSTGIGMIVTACKRVRASGGTFSVWCDNGLTRRTLEITGLVDYLELHDGEDLHLNQQGASFVDDARTDGQTG